MRLHQRLRREQGRHTDDWLITYADTITLLLCLFVIILSIKTSDKNLMRDAPVSVNHSAATEDFFGGHSPFGGLTRTAVTPSDEIPRAAIVTATEAEPSIPGRVSPAPDETPLESIDDVPWGGSDTPEHAGLVAAWAVPLMAMPSPVPPGTERPETVSASLPAVVDRLKSQGTAVVEQQGDRITTLQINSAAFFGSGNAALSGAGKSILLDVAVTLKSSDFAAYHISIEGHTDDTPISTAQFQSNWELSTARAAAVVRFLLEQGISAGKLSAAGYADTFPVAPNRTPDGMVIPENQTRNRRVVIKLEKIDRAER